MSVHQCTRDARALLEGDSQEQITLADAIQKAKEIQLAYPKTFEKLNMVRHALDVYSAESSLNNLAAIANVVMTFPGDRDLIIKKAREIGF